MCTLAAAFLCACASRQQLPVAISKCDAVKTPQGMTLVATVASKALKPISSLGLRVEFYQNFRSSSAQAGRTIAELDPGQQRDITFALSGSAVVQGRAMRCFATHVGYLDGTSQDVEHSQ